MSFSSCSKIPNHMMMTKRGTIVEELVSCRQMMQLRKNRCKSMEHIKAIKPMLKRQEQQQPPLSAYKTVFDCQNPNLVDKCAPNIIDREMVTTGESLQYLATPRTILGAQALSQGSIKACSHRQAAVLLAQKASKLRALPKEFLEAKTRAPPKEFLLETNAME